MVYSGWKFILFLVFDRITSNFMCWTFSTLRSSSLWRIVTIFLLLEKVEKRPITTLHKSVLEKTCSRWYISLNKTIPHPSSKNCTWKKKKFSPSGGLNKGFTASKMLRTRFQFQSTPRNIGNLFKMADRRFPFLSFILGLISNLTACFQANLALLILQTDYSRRRQNIIRLLSLPVLDLPLVWRCSDFDI